MENSQTLRNFRARKSTSRLKFAQNKTDSLNYDVLDAMTASALNEEASRQACAFPKKSKRRRAACSKIRPMPLITQSPQFAHNGRSIWVASGAVGGKVGGKEGDSVGAEEKQKLN